MMCHYKLNKPQKRGVGRQRLVRQEWPANDFSLFIIHYHNWDGQNLAHHYT